MQLIILAVGRLRPAFRELCEDYQRRLSRFATIRETGIRESRKPGAEGRREEGSRLRERIPEGSMVVALDREGKGWTSEQLAHQVGRWQEGGRHVTLVIGGSTGLDPSILDAADTRWSLGPGTLPHELARVVVYEQLYRAFTIMRGMPYHK
ncbi:MAG: 23S rRNA (pseudouridine(1915)-N(3))-methyltransferase RlmH [Gemmatimonadales bacterium]